jgi:hypothetical protein
MGTTHRVVLLLLAAAVAVGSPKDRQHEEDP